jgi:aspartokinase-like uncharacterized kinase
MSIGSRPAAQIFAGPGFKNFGVQTVVKFGGSLLADVATARGVAEVLAEVPDDHGLLVFPGGGPTDNLIESISLEAGIDGPTRNPACMRALDQTGIMLAALHPRLTAVESLAEVRTIRDRGQVPVLLPSRLILSLDVFTREDVITSDSLGAYFAFLVGADRYVVLTDVDGVYESIDGPAEEHRLIGSVTAEELEKMGATSVDQCLAPFLRVAGLPTWVINGTVRSRLAEVLAGGRPRGTRIDVRDIL